MLSRSLFVTMWESTSTISKTREPRFGEAESISGELQKVTEQVGCDAPGLEQLNGDILVTLTQ